LNRNFNNLGPPLPLVNKNGKQRVLHIQESVEISSSPLAFAKVMVGAKS